ncbi:hypothetical protein EIL87_11575 [Saccharopolyspora rhizosphaerae]|uniref:DUF3040 domain-containing protein n=1 Tax=Saccharopolyspora rhizosphaerae TaxID=2492662 RepID=A0A3R8P0L4_9PSEU|nr:hypothetical protein [Saccharopolyspora rhizosphaerae]RRO16919.1 hypothetical protein EIL87_11575 [Saccharopolyspora rhizosphaerae]
MIGSGVHRRQEGAVMERHTHQRGTGADFATGRGRHANSGGGGVRGADWAVIVIAIAAVLGGLVLEQGLMIAGGALLALSAVHRLEGPKTPGRRTRARKT